MAEQELNSLSRFRKQPGRLILEQFDHCEVPAGCGGVVLRWRNPHAELPVILYLYTPKTPTLWIDGLAYRSAGMHFTPGPHLIALHLQDVNLSGGLLMFLLKYDPKRRQPDLPSGVVEQAFTIASQADAWKYTLQAPEGDNWRSLDFDDATWPTLSAVPTPQLADREDGAWQVRQCTEGGAVCLGVPTEGRDVTPGAIWIRHKMIIPTPQYLQSK